MTTGKNIDLLQGSITGKLLAFGVPMIVSNLLQAIYGIVDMIVVGQFVGSNAVSGITNGGQVISLATQIIIGMTTGGGVLIGQSFGKRDQNNVRSYCRTLYTMCVTGGLAFAIILIVLSRPLLFLIHAPAYQESLTYLQICAGGLFFVFVYNGLSSSARAVGNSKLPLYCILATTLLNTVLDVVFVGGIHMGVAGAAYATVISQGLSVAICALHVFCNKELYGVVPIELSKDWLRLKKIIRVGLPLAFQNCIAALSWLTMTFLVNDYGVICSAGNGISIRIKDLCQTFTAAMAGATSTMVAQNIGAGQYERAKETMIKAMRITMSMATCLIIIVEIFANGIASAFSGEGEVIAAAALNMRIEIIGQLFYASFFIYHSLATGSGHTPFVMFSSFVNCILVRIVLALLLNRFFGLVGIYIACMIAPSASIPLGAWFVRSERWKKAEVVSTV